jgi:hypothetical protein
MTDYTELKRLADAATQGKWCTDGARQVMSAESDQLNSGFVIVDCQGPDNLKNAAFIAAANPAAVLALIAENEALRNGLADAKYRLEQGRVWNGMSWTLTGLNSHCQQQALTAIDAALSKEA